MFYNLSKMESIDCTIIYACLTSYGYEEYINKKVFHNYFEEEKTYEDDLYKKYQIYIDPGVNVVP